MSTPASLPDHLLWWIIERIGWKNWCFEFPVTELVRYNTQKDIIGFDNVAAVRDFVDARVAELARAVEGLDDLSDDSFDDAAAHAVSLGKDEYTRLRDDPQLWREYAASRSWKESFRYVLLPLPTPQSLATRLKAVIDAIERFTPDVRVHEVMRRIVHDRLRGYAQGQNRPSEMDDRLFEAWMQMVSPTPNTILVHVMDPRDIVNTLVELSDCVNIERFEVAPLPPAKATYAVIYAQSEGRVTRLIRYTSATPVEPLRVGDPLGSQLHEIFRGPRWDGFHLIMP